VVSAGNWNGSWQEYALADESSLVSHSIPNIQLLHIVSMDMRRRQHRTPCYIVLRSFQVVVGGVVLQLAVPDSLEDDAAAQFYVNPVTVVGLVDSAGVPKVLSRRLLRS
jgi:hypothetical protein